MQRFDHARILPIIGISFYADNSPLIITPYMHNGSVLDYIRNANNVCVFNDLFDFFKFIEMIRTNMIMSAGAYSTPFVAMGGRNR
jgi:hypothetical protein